MDRRTYKPTAKQADKKVQPIFYCPYENKATRAERQILHQCSELDKGDSSLGVNISILRQYLKNLQYII